jgi:hypothetical protein
MSSLSSRSTVEASEVSYPRRSSDSDSRDPRYYRFQTELNVGSDDMDNATATSLAALAEKARQMLDESSHALETLSAELTPESPRQPKSKS